MIENKTVLITGGAGFIGSNLCEILLQQNNKVICMDNFLTGKKENIEPFFKNKNFNLIEGDIRNLSDCKKAVKSANIVLHQAALGSVPRSIKDPVTTNEVNINGFLNMQQWIAYNQIVAVEGEEIIQKTRVSSKTHVSSYRKGLNLKYIYCLIFL